MKKLHKLKTQTGEWIPSHTTNVKKTIAREHARLKEDAEKKEKSNVRDMSDIFKGVKHGK